jgi:hypothetical protein
MWEERQVVKGGGSVLNGSGVQFRNSTWKNTASGSSQWYHGVAKAQGEGCGRKYRWLSELLCRIGLRGLNGKQYG